MQANRKKIKLKTGREVTIRALGMLTLRNLRGTLPIAARDEHHPMPAEEEDTTENYNRGIDFVCAECVDPNFTNTLEPAADEVSVDDLSVGEFTELAEAIKQLSGIDGGSDPVVPLSGTTKA